MKTGKYILSLDQGTTSSRAIVFNSLGGIVGVSQKEFTQYYPKPGYVEHDPVEILETQLYAMRQAIEESGISYEDVAAIGITNQRETVIAWDKISGIPVYNAIVWQCRRTAPICEELKNKGLEDYIKKTTGLIIDPYFSGTKMKWMLENVPEVKRLNDEKRLCFGTVDTWLIFSLTEGKTFVTDVSNASRTMLFDINNLKWDERMLEEMGVDIDSLPKVVSSSEVVGMASAEIFGKEIPIAGIAGDQHAALFGQCCFEEGMAKNTYGTGCFVLMNTGEKPVFSNKGLLTTIGWKLGDKVAYALEGSAFNAGSAIKWLRDELQLIKTPQECDALAETVEDTAGAMFVPAFTGLGAPYWDMYARGSLLGITRGTTKAHICRAVLESIACESYDLFDTMEEESGVKLKELRVDGGASRSRFLMQCQADLIGRKVVRPVCLETTALGAAMLAGLATDVWSSTDELKEIWKVNAVYEPDADNEAVPATIERWHKAVKCSMGWAK
ncbi:MAG: glycerol kinase GlpK [Ruminococcaceae bacterium]|nr:glycerol kinase GlpK [Oscillospiraceae bacterium]